MLLMHGAFLVPPNRREGPGPASSSLPGRGGAARLPQCRWERERALGGPGLGKGSPSQQMPAPTSFAETQSHGLPWEEPGDVCFWPPQSLGRRGTGNVGSGRQRELVRRKAISAQGRACQQGAAVDVTTCLSLRFPSMGRESLQSSGTQEEVLPGEGGVLRLCVGGSDGWRPQTRGAQRDRPA